MPGAARTTRSSPRSPDVFVLKTTARRDESSAFCQLSNHRPESGGRFETRSTFHVRVLNISCPAAMSVDEVYIHVAAGNGGRGCLAFRREKRVPRGGPSGGDGGHGGSVYIVASAHTNTLINYRFHPEFTAERGGHGEGSNRTGHTASDLELAVPIGTLVYEKPSV